MIAKKKIIWIFLFFSMLFLVTPAYAIPGTWRGFVFKGGAIAADGTYVIAALDNDTETSVTVGSVSTWAAGYYLINVVGASGNKVNFKVCGVYVDMVAQDWSFGLHNNTTSGSPYMNLSISTLGNGVSCTYSCACTGGYCCSSATEYTDGSGTGSCRTSACAAATTTTTAVSRPGGGGVSDTTTTTSTVSTTTTTTLPPVEETQSIESIGAGEAAAFIFTDTNLLISEIEVTASVSVTSPSVTLSQSSFVPATVPTSAPNSVYGYLTVTKSNIEDADVSSVKIKFKVAKTWISENNIDEATVILQRYAGGAWAALETTEVNEDGTYLYFEAISPGLSVFAITAVQLVTPTTTTSTVPTTTTTRPVAFPGGTVGLIAVVVLIILVVLFILWKNWII